jgi:hypothetical protein
MRIKINKASRFIGMLFNVLFEGYYFDTWNLPDSITFPEGSFN